ncbi:hypothetical protein, partial [Thalassobacter stenotrophicus]|uniref:hypothetical protein n=1 Tax=Thalassobacter stenotrophicus TaxID=266809 RepID=UPI001F35330C
RPIALELREARVTGAPLTFFLSERNVKVFLVDLTGNTIKLSKQCIITLAPLLFPKLLEEVKLSLFIV